MGESADGYRPTFESGCINLDEGSGGSDEIGGAGEGASVGVSAEFGNINLSNGYGNSSDKSGGKRKRIENAEKASNKKMVNVPASKKIADAISRIATASESRSTTVNKLVVPGASIGEVMAEMQNFEALESNIELHSRCCQLMMFEPARQMFVALKGNEEKLLAWLKFAAYNPSPFMKT